MDEHGLARILGWVSIGVGLSAIAAPVPLMRAFGMDARPKLAHFWRARPRARRGDTPGAERGSLGPGPGRRRRTGRGAYHWWRGYRGLPKGPSTDRPRRCRGL